MHQDAAIAGLGRVDRPAPLDVQLVVGIGTGGQQVAGGLADDGDGARRGHVADGGDVRGGIGQRRPAGEILAVEQIDWPGPGRRLGVKARDGGEQGKDGDRTSEGGAHGIDRG